MPHFRTIAAFLIAPLAIPVGLSLASAVFPGSSPVSLTDFFGLIALYSLFSLPPAYLFELVLGIPAWLFFRRHGIRAWSAFAVGGAVLGITSYVAWYVAAKAIGYNIGAYPLVRRFDPKTPWLAVPAGLACAILFRAIIFPRSSHESPKQPTTDL
jgi:membrane protease YdiL (CAAX protease family)